MLGCCAALLLGCCSALLMYGAILLCCYVAVLLYCYIGILLCCFVARLLCCFVDVWCHGAMVPCGYPTRSTAARVGGFLGKNQKKCKTVLGYSYYSVLKNLPGRRWLGRWSERWLGGLVRTLVSIWERWLREGRWGQRPGKVFVRSHDLFIEPSRLESLLLLTPLAYNPYFY